MRQKTEIITLTDSYKQIPNTVKLDRSPYAFLIGRLIKEMRIEQNMTQGELAQRIGKKKPYLSKIENGGVEISLKELVLILEKGFGKFVSLDLKDITDVNH